MTYLLDHPPVRDQFRRTRREAESGVVVHTAESTPDATNDRIDLIQIRVSDDSAGAGVTTIDVKAGTPAGSPSAPTPDENAMAAGSTDIAYIEVISA